MYCSTCGSRVAEGRVTCQVCGATAARTPMPGAFAPQPYVPAQQPVYASAPVQVCPRCGFRGMSASYFSRGSHVAVLAGLAVFFFPAAIAYLIVRGSHRSCPACGYGWGSQGARALTLMPNGTPIPTLNEPALPVAGSAKKGWGTVMLVFAGIMMAVGLANMVLPPIIIGALFGVFGGMLLKGARTDREQRRDAILQSLQLPVMQLAARKGGRLTVTDVATEMGWPMARAEKVLNSLDDGMRVMSDITDEGVIVYDFLEIRTAHLSRGGNGGGLNALPA